MRQFFFVRHLFFRQVGISAAENSAARPAATHCQTDNIYRYLQLRDSTGNFRSGYPTKKYGDFLIAILSNKYLNKVRVNAGHHALHTTGVNTVHTLNSRMPALLQLRAYDRHPVILAVADHGLVRNREFAYYKTFCVYKSLLPAIYLVNGDIDDDIMIELFMFGSDAHLFATRYRLFVDCHIVVGGL